MRILEWISDTLGAAFELMAELFWGTVIDVTAKFDAAIDDFGDWLSRILIMDREENGK